MKKDIQIPEVSGVEMAIVLEHNEVHKTDDWNVYIINKKDIAIEMVVIVSQGFSETKTTSVFRKKIDLLSGNSIAKIELIQPELFALDNRFQVTFFENNTLQDKTFTFKKDTIKESNLQIIQPFNKRGVIIS
ncbi:hypothetical protein [Tenacibaculum halocynthiae]|uniref:hypothetical protein n=1 Tax=Tenacibaculum halocynthiae TaxID=1254437 RepID=UPI0038938B33